MLAGKLRTQVIHLEEAQTAAVFDCFQRVQEYERRSGFLAEKLLCFALLQLIMLTVDLSGQSILSASQTIHPQLILALQFINEHHAENIALDLVAEAVHMSKYHFCRLFHSATGATFLEYLTNVRLARAHRMLVETDLTIEDIASAVGFSSSVNMSRVFRKVYHMAPKDFRKNRITVCEISNI